MTGGGPLYEPFEHAPPDAAFVVEARQERIAAVLAQRTRTLTVVLDGIEDAFNMAAVLRTCEGLGIQDVHLVDGERGRVAPNPRVMQGCHKWLDVHRYTSFAHCAASLRASGFRIVASAAAQGATALFDLDFAPRTALVFGNERVGVSDAALAGADELMWIPMRGFSQSLNISAAVAATMTNALAWRAQRGRPAGDLSAEDHRLLHERFLRLSMKQHKRMPKIP